MHITNQQQLKRQKRKLSILFTLILFFVVTGLQIVFLIGRYINSGQKELMRMNNELPRVKMLGSLFFSGAMKPDFPPMPMMPTEGRGRRLKGGNMVVYNPDQNKVLLSSLEDDEMVQEITSKIIGEKKHQGSIVYNKNELLFIRDTIGSGNHGIFFIPAQINISDVIRDSFLFVLFFGICSLLFYRVIYWFVGKVFLPIEENMQDMEQFVYNAGHELKTPLSVIKSHLQLAFAKKQYQSAIDESIKEVDKMNILLESLVNLSIVQQEFTKEPVYVEQELESIVSQYINNANKNSLTIKIKIKDSCKILANKSHVAVVIANILSNAIKYNKPHGKIYCSLENGILRIEDTGIGIPEKEKSKIFDRFYQVGNVRNQDGFGIGLALVKKIVDLYGWSITVESEENKGTTVSIKF